MFKKIRQTRLFKWFNTAHGKTIAFIGAILFLIEVLALPKQISETVSYYKTFKSDSDSLKQFNPLFEQQTLNSTINILTLPLHPDQDCLAEKTDYDRQIVEHFNTRVKMGYSIQAKYDPSVLCPTDTQAIEHGKKNNADIVVWGFYDEECSDFSKRVKLKCAVVTGSKAIFETEYTRILNVTDLAKGINMEQVTAIINYSIVLKAESEKNYAKAIKHLESIPKSEIDDNLLVHWMFYSYEMKNYKEVIRLSHSLNLLSDLEYKKAALSLRSKSFFALGDTAAGLQYLTRQIELSNDASYDLYSSLYSYRSKIYLHTGRLKKCIEDCDSIILRKHGLTNPSIDAINTRSAAFYFLGEFEMCLSDLEILLNTEPNNCNWMILKAECFFSLKEYQTVIDVLKPCQKLNCSPEWVEELITASNKAQSNLAN